MNIIYTNENGGVSVVIPAPKFIQALVDSGETEESALLHIAKRDVPVKLTADGIINDNPVLIGQWVRRIDADEAEIAYTNTPYEIVDAAIIPTDRTFRNAWEKSGKTIIHNINKAQLLAHDMRRVMRDKEMKPLDIKATIPSEATQAEVARQVVRDSNATMQTDIDNAVDVTELKTALGI